MHTEVWESSEIGGPVNQHAFNMSSFEHDKTSITTLIDNNDGCAQLYDDGDGVEIVIHKKKIKLDYYESVQVLVLLQSNMDQNFEFRESKIIKSF